MLNELNISDKYVSWLNDKEVNKYSVRNGKTLPIMTLVIMS